MNHASQILNDFEYTARPQRGQPTFARNGGATAAEPGTSEIPKIRLGAPDKIALATFCYVGQA
jgi:hypothetical protein